MTNLCLDPFTRTTANGLGNEPITGQAYQLNTTNTAYSTTGAVARITTSTVNQLYYATVPTGSADHVVRVTTTLSVVPVGAAITLRAVARWADASNYVEAQLNVGTTGNVSLQLQKRVTGVNTSIMAGPVVGTHAAGNAWTVVVEVYGMTARARAWNASTGSDPGVWQAFGSFTDATLTSGAQAGFGCRRETSNTNGVQVDFDDFSAATLLDVLPQDVYPPRNLITVSGLLVGDPVTVYRLVAGNRTPVRAGSTPSVTDVAFLCVDAELPFGVPVSYVAVVNNDETDTAPVTYTLPGGKVALSDAISGLAAEVVIWAWPTKDYARPATVFKPGGRNVVVSGDFAQYESDIELYTDATSSAENLRTLLAAATQGIVQIRQPGGYDDVDGYAAVTDYQVRRYAQDGSDDKRIHQLHLVEVDGWATSLAASGFTYQDVANAYTGLTYANLAADFPTYLALDQGDFS